MILNAEIKFRRYLREAPAPAALPSDVMELINKTIKLVELIYWDPVTWPGTRARMLADAMEVDVSPKVPQSPATGKMGMKVDDEDNDPKLRPRNVGNIKQRRPGPSATLEERRDYGQYLLSGHGKFLHHVFVWLS